MRKKKYVYVICFLLIFIISACGSEKKEKEKTDELKSTDIELSDLKSTDMQISEEDMIADDVRLGADDVSSDADDAENKNSEETEKMLSMKIGNYDVDVRWEDNDAVDKLKELCEDNPLTIEMSMYGGFEQVGPIGTSLPADDKQTKTSSGDIVLYSGNQLVVFYGSNSWAYTRLGHIIDKSDAEMKELLGNGDVTILISLE